MNLADFLKSRNPKELPDGNKSRVYVHNGTLIIGDRPSDEQLLTEYYTKWKGENLKLTGAQAIPRFYIRVRKFTNCFFY